MSIVLVRKSAHVPSGVLEIVCLGSLSGLVGWLILEGSVGIFLKTGSLYILG